MPKTLLSPNELRDAMQPTLDDFLGHLEAVMELAETVRTGDRRYNLQLSNRIRRQMVKLPKVLEFVQYATIGQYLEYLLETQGCVWLSRHEEDVSDLNNVRDQPIRFTADLPHAGKPLSVTRETIIDCIADISGRPISKKCRGACGRRRPLSHFQRLASSRDGHSPACKYCERERVREIHRAKRGPAKECVACGIEKPLMEFDRESRLKDGYRGICKECRKKKG